MYILNIYICGMPLYEMSEAGEREGRHFDDDDIIILIYISGPAAFCISYASK